jgi:tRNA pseudouridine55 synthase
MSDFLLIDKPAGWTSHDVVAYLRGVFRGQRIGHAGTLDPFATGLLVLGLGPATKKLREIMGLEKEYLATVRFGGRSTTDDKTGAIEEVAGAKPVLRDALLIALKKFIGEIEQIPPMYSAKKIRGRKLYELARRGEVVERKPAKVAIHEIELVEDRLPLESVLKIRCSSGTYIRALARDLGEALGSGAYLTELRRTRIGPYRVEDAVLPKNVSADKKENRP